MSKTGSKSTSLPFYLIIPVIVVGLILVLGLKVVKTKTTQTLPAQKDTSPSLTPTKALNIKPPYMSLSYTNQRNVFKFSIQTQDQTWNLFDRITYEFMYNSSRGPRGVLGEFNKDKLEDEIFLGSESSGKKVYDTGVTNGQITLHLESDDGQVVTIGPYDFIVGGYGARDKWATEKLTLTLDKKTNQRFILLANSGYPTDQPAPANKPYLVISLMPEDINLNGNLEIADADISSKVNTIEYKGEKIDFKTNGKGISFTLAGGGDYLIY